MDFVLEISSNNRARTGSTGVEDLLADGYLSEIEDLYDEDLIKEEYVPNFYDNLADEDLLSDDDIFNRNGPEERPLSRSPLPSQSIPSLPASATGLSSAERRGRSISPTPHTRKWKRATFPDKSHNYTTLPASPVRSPLQYFNDYFDNDFMEEIARCTSLYYLRDTGKELKVTASEICKLFSIHLVMGCIPYPRLHMYWRTGTKLALVCGVMARDRFLAVRNALHVIDSGLPVESEKNNPLWKVQPMINKLKDACNKLERMPGVYSIHEQIIPLVDRCPLRQGVKNKRPVGLKNFVLTTSEGLMFNFEIYPGSKLMFGDTRLGLGPSVILHLVKTLPPDSCVYHDRYFTTIPLIEEMEKLNLHSTGTIMQSRIDRDNIEFKKDKQMGRGESDQFISKPTAVVKWKDNKSALIASNCTGADTSLSVKRWDKRTKSYVYITAPKVVQRYNKNMGDVLGQQMECCRTYIKTKKWTLKVIIHCLDLAVANSWILYKNDCLANGVKKKDIMLLLDFRLNLADNLSNIPTRTRNECRWRNRPRSAVR